MSLTLQRNQIRRSFLATAAGAAILFAGLLVLMWLDRRVSAAADVQVVPAAVSYPAPDVELTDLEGQPVALRDQRGHVVLVNLWATWCAPCKTEMPALQQFYARHAPEGFTVIAINVGEQAPDVSEFAEELRLTFPIWLDPASVSTDQAFHVLNLPSSFVIDREGVVRLSWVGGIDRPGLEKYVTPLIQE